MGKPTPSTGFPRTRSPISPFPLEAKTLNHTTATTTESHTHLCFFSPSKANRQNMSLSLPITTYPVLILLILYAALPILDQISQLLKQRHVAANVALTAQLREVEIAFAEFGTEVSMMKTAVKELTTKLERAVRNRFQERAALEKIWQPMGRGQDFMRDARVLRESAGREGDNNATTGEENDVD
ncbi:MAG: hypothetical protein Q9207_008289 [Kuettlingeria erythrocarpa]